MRSFGLWYKCNESATDSPIFSLDINFWSESVKKKNSAPALDIGIKIEEFKNLNKLIFHCPFKVNDSDITDLSEKLSKKENANIIFNIDGEIETKDSYFIYSFEKNNKREALLLCPLSPNFSSLCNSPEEVNQTDICFDFSKIFPHIKGKQKFTNITGIYIRFRITSKEFQNNIYFDCEPANKSFESAFSGTRIFDFKINEKRNLDSRIITKIEQEHYSFSQLENVHLLVMEPSSYDLESFANNQLTCRELENTLWDDYFGEHINYSKGRILAYHWKFKGECSCLIKIRYSKTNLSTIMAYIIIALSIGIVGEAIISTLQSALTTKPCLTVFISYVVGIILFIIGLFWGRKQ